MSKQTRYAKSFNEHINLNGTMIRAKNLIINPGVLHSPNILLGNKKIIQPPSNILSPAPRPHTPPGVLDQVRIKVPKRINPPPIQPFAETFPLLQCESSRLLVAFGLCDVDLFVAYVEVAADYC
jgi:hypothetical protein